MLGASPARRARSRQLGHTAYRAPHVAGKRGAFFGAGPPPGVPERRPRDGNDLPGIAAVVERQLQHAEAGVVADLTVGDRRPERIPLFAAAGPRDELAHATHRIRDTGGCLRCEALVVVLVSADHHLHAAVIQHLPGGLPAGGPAIAPPGTEPA